MHRAPSTGHSRPPLPRLIAALLICMIAAVGLIPIGAASPARADSRYHDIPESVMAPWFKHGGNTTPTDAQFRIGLSWPTYDTKVYAGSTFAVGPVCLSGYSDHPTESVVGAQNGLITFSAEGTQTVTVECSDKDGTGIHTARRPFTVKVLPALPPSPDEPDYRPSEDPAPYSTAHITAGLDVAVTPTKPQEGDVLQLNVTLAPESAPESPTAMVWAFENGARVGEGPIKNKGTGVLYLPGLQVGRHKLKLVYAGNEEVKPTSREVVVDILARSVITTDAGNSVEVFPGEPARFTMFVDSKTPVTGDVTLSRVENGQTGEVIGTYPASSNGVVVELGVLPEGSHMFKLSYAGTGEIGPSEHFQHVTVVEWYPAKEDTFYVPAGQPSEIAAPGVLANDVTGDITVAQLYADWLTPPAHGSGRIDTTGKVYYTPDAGFAGTDKMQYRLKNFSGQGRIQSRVIDVKLVVGDPWLRTATVQTQRYGSDEWVAVDADHPIVAGNPARVSYSITNPTGTRTNLAMRLLDPEGNPVEGTSESIDLAPGQTVSKEVALPTSARAYAKDGTSKVDPWKYRVSAIPTGKGEMTKTVDVPVAPRPVVLAHGYNSSAATWSSFTDMMRQQDPRLTGYAVGDKQFDGSMNTGQLPSTDSYSIHQNAVEEALYIAGVQRATGARHVDVVAHSMGGLITREYIQQLMPATTDGRPLVTHLVQLGTPNMGSPCADLMVLGASSWGLPGAFPEPATTQLTTYAADQFNTAVTDLKGVELSNLVGTDIPLGCGLVGVGDGIVPSYSARWAIPTADLMERTIPHTSMTADQDVVNDYVVPRLADAPGTGVQTANRVTAASADAPVETFAIQRLQIEKGATANLPVTVPASSLVGASTMVAGVVLELRNPAGALVATSKAGDPALPMVGVSSAVTADQAGKSWSLRAVNESGSAVDVPVVFWITGGTATAEAISAKRYADGATWVKARVLVSGKPAAGSTVTVQASDHGTPLGSRVTLLDDGRHDDGAAGDGVFGGKVAGVPATGEPVVSVTATVAGQGSRFALQLVSTGSGSAPAEPSDPPAPPAKVTVSDPKSVTAAAGTTAVFSVTTTGKVDRVRWQMRVLSTWVDIPGATTATLSLPKVSRLLSGMQVRATVSGAAGQAVSKAATLTVTKATTTTSGVFAMVQSRPMMDVKVTSTAVPRGSVQVYEGTRLLGSVSLLFVGTSKATVTLPSMSKGTHTLRVRYLGDLDTAESWSNPITVKIS